MTETRRPSRNDRIIPVIYTSKSSFGDSPLMQRTPPLCVLQRTVEIDFSYSNFLISLVLEWPVIDHLAHQIFGNLFCLWKPFQKPIGD